MANALRTEGYTVFLVKTVAEGSQGMFDILPHLIIMDLAVTASGDGAYDILEKKKSEPLLAKIPVFLLSTQDAPINMRRIPAGNPTVEFIMSLQPEPAEIVKRVNRALGHFVFGPDGDPAEGGTARAASHDQAGKKTILWVEDDKLIGSILGKRLISAEFNLVHVNDGKEAMSQLKTVTPDIIVLDLLLPGMDGFDILQKIKMDSRLKKIPVMILSNLSKPGDLEKAKLLGATKFIVKAASSLDNIIEEVKKIVS